MTALVPIKRQSEPTAIVDKETGKVVNAEQLRRYWRDRNLLLYRMRRGMFADLPELYHEPRREAPPLLEQEIIHRHIHYDSDVSKKQWGRIDAISGQLNFLQTKLNEHIDAAKKAGAKRKAKYTEYKVDNSPK